MKKSFFSIFIVLCFFVSNTAAINISEIKHNLNDLSEVAINLNKSIKSNYRKNVNLTIDCINKENKQCDMANTLSDEYSKINEIGYLVLVNCQYLSEILRYEEVNSGIIKYFKKNIERAYDNIEQAEILRESLSSERNYVFSNSSMYDSKTNENIETLKKELQKSIWSIKSLLGN